SAASAYLPCASSPSSLAMSSGVIGVGAAAAPEGDVAPTAEAAFALEDSGRAEATGVPLLDSVFWPDCARRRARASCLLPPVAKPMPARLPSTTTTTARTIPIHFSSLRISGPVVDPRVEG